MAVISFKYVTRNLHVIILYHHIFQNGKSTILYSDNVFHKYILMWKIFLEIIKRKIKIHERIDMELLSNEYLYDWNVMSCHVRALDCYNTLFDLLVFHTSL